MTIVTIAAEHPGGRPRAYGTVLVSLVAGSAGGSDGDAVVVDVERVRLDAAGLGQIDLEPNTAITPADSYYRFTVAASSPTVVRTIALTGATPSPVAWDAPAIQVVEAPVGARYVPAPAGQPDGMALVTEGGRLVYGAATPPGGGAVGGRALDAVGGVVDLAAAPSAAAYAVAWEPGLVLHLPDPSGSPRLVVTVADFGGGLGDVSYTIEGRPAGVVVVTGGADVSGDGYLLELQPGPPELAGFADWSAAGLPAASGGGGGGVSLGETSTTAYRGDRGRAAYDHAQINAGNPHGTTAADVGADPAGTAAAAVAAAAPPIWAGTSPDLPPGPGGLLAGAAATNATVADQFFVFPLEVLAPQTLAALVVFVSTLEAGASARLGLYYIASPTIGHLPAGAGALVVDGAVSAASTGVKRISTSTALANPGAFGLGIGGSSGHAASRYRRFSSPPVGLLGWSQGNNAAYIGWRATLATGGGLPALTPAMTLVTAAAGDVPYIGAEWA